ncbi:MAG: DUF2062 domain-containing protein [Gammaproteobacteria bacterium]|nr:DUF2062 domain-containing protein [Gammaproteobacteria bacterium]
MLAPVRRYLVDPILALLQQGLAPRQLALCLALGAGIGMFPVLGVSTPVLTLLALWLRLNLAAIQLVSWLIGPLQLAMIIPFMRFGEWLVGADAQPLTIEAGMQIIAQGVLQAIVTLWDAIVHASIGWMLIGPAAIYVLYRLLIPVLERALQRLKTVPPT